MQSPIEVVRRIEDTWHRNSIEEWEFLYINTDIFLRAAMTPERLPGSFEYKVVVRVIDANPRWLRSFIQAMKATHFEKTTGHTDIRFGFIVRDTHEREVGSVFMDWHSQRVLINKTLYRVEGPLSRFFKDLANTVVHKL